MITLNDYQGDGFGEGMNTDQLRKAMEAGHITGRETDGLSLTQEPLKMESLERSLKLLEFRMQDIKLWNAIPKKAAYNTVEEFLQLESYGSNRGGFYREGELPRVVDSKYVRRSELVKYIQVAGEVTMQAQVVRSYTDAMTQEIENKMKWVLRKANESLTKADSTYVDEEFNSLYKQHASIGVGLAFNTFDDYYKSATVIDLRGASLKQENVEDGAVRVDQGYGLANTLFAPTTVISALSQDYYQRQRIFMNMSSQAFSGTIGTTPKAISTTIGDIALMTDKFMERDKPKENTDPATDAYAPNAPTVSAITVAANAKSKYAAADAGDVLYAVTGVNRYGESAPTVFATAITLAAGSSVDLAIAAGAGANETTAYVIYRSKKGDDVAAEATFYPLYKISAAELAAGHDGGATGHSKDHGYFLPDCEEAFLTQMDDEVLAFKQLAPLSKLDLATLGPARRFMIFLWGTPQLYARKKFIKYINCGKKLSLTV